jgi:NitT/TauT family transport system substrate-binding protein
VAPEYVAEELLRAEGFEDISYIPVGSGVPAAEAVARGDIDISMNFVAALVAFMDVSAKITILAGVHPGCFELFARSGIDHITDLKGKSVGVQALGSSPHLFLASMAAYVGLDPMNDINWIVDPSVKPKQLFMEGKIDAFLGFPPEPQELRSRNLGHVIVNSALDQPWSQYFCCMIAGNRHFVTENPMASKRALRAIMKAADLCVAEPERAARRLVEGKFTERYDLALQALREVPYRKWRDYDPEDSIRFYALRLRESGMIRSDPQSLIATATDWRLINELRRELKS